MTCQVAHWHSSRGFADLCFFQSLLYYWPVPFILGPGKIHRITPHVAMNANLFLVKMREFSLSFKVQYVDIISNLVFLCVCKKTPNATDAMQWIKIVQFCSTRVAYIMTVLTESATFLFYEKTLKNRICVMLSYTIHLTWSVLETWGMVQIYSEAMYIIYSI